MESWKQELYASDVGQAYLAHHGIKGQKWGVRRYQNEDGTLTPEGRARYAPKDTDSDVTKKVKEDLLNLSRNEFVNKYQTTPEKYMKRVDKYGDPYMRKSNYEDAKKKMYSELDAYQAEQSKAKNIAKSIIFGETGRTTYDIARSQGDGRGKAFITSLFDLGFGSVADAAITEAGTVTDPDGNKYTNLLTTALGRAADYGISKLEKESNMAGSLQQRRLARNYMNGNK